MIKTFLVIVLLCFPHAQAASIDRPDDQITRAETAVLLSREFFEEKYIQSFAATRFFEDVPPDAWYAGAFGVLHQRGIWSNEPYVMPEMFVSRYEFLHALFSLQKNSVPNFSEDKPLSLDVFDTNDNKHTVFSNAVAMGIVTVEANSVLPDELITRAEASRLLNAFKQYQSGSSVEVAKELFWKQIFQARDGGADASYRAILLVKGMLQHRADPDILAMQKLAWAMGKRINGDEATAQLFLDDSRLLDEHVYNVFQQGDVPLSTVFLTDGFVTLLRQTTGILTGVFVLP